MQRELPRKPLPGRFETRDKRIRAGSHAAEILLASRP